MQAIGFDIGGSTIRAGRVAFDGETWTVQARQHVQLDPSDKTPGAMIEHIVGLVVELSGSDRPEQVTMPVGVGFPAQLRPPEGYVVNAPNLGWREVPFGEQLASRLPGTRLRIDNDLNAILLGEHRFGGARGCRHVVALYPGTGIGGAVMIDGRILRGAGGFAGEVGHIGMGGAGPCGCGQVGCAETIAGGRYIEARVAAARTRGELDESHYRGVDPVRVNHIDAAWAAGEAFARRLWSEVVDVLSGLGATACALLDPEMVLLGGGVMAHAPNLLEEVSRAIVERSPEVCRRRLRVVMGSLGDDAGLLGAVVLATESS